MLSNFFSPNATSLFATVSGSRWSASEPLNPGSALPVNDVGQEVVVPEPVVDVHLVVVDRQGSIDDAPLLKSRVGFTTEHHKRHMSHLRHTSHLRHSIMGPSYRYFILPSLLTCESIELVSTYSLQIPTLIAWRRSLE